MRHPGDVIEKILGVLPDDQEDLRARLKSVQESSNFCPPEGQYLWWRRLAEVMGKAAEEMGVTDANLDDPQIPEWLRQAADFIQGVA